MLIEQTTTYAYKLKYLENPSFDKVKTLAKKFIDELPQALVDDLFNAINRDVDILKTEPEMLVYLYYFGNMHKAKLDFAFDKIPEEFFSQPEINIIDYGCGQAIGTMCYADFLKSKNYNQRIKSVTLIEPSEICIKRAALHTSEFLPDAKIVTVNKTFDELVEEDIYCEDNVPTLHILSNVLDLEFDLERFSELIKGRLLGYNQFICVGPLFYSDNLDHRMRYFSEFIGGDVLFSESFGIEGNNWTCQSMVQSVGEMEDYYSMWVTDEDFENGVEDEFGVVYSKDGKRLLKCWNPKLTNYEIKPGTKIICGQAFYYCCYGETEYEYDYLLENIIIPDTVVTIGDGAFYGCFYLKQVIIPQSTKIIGSKAFCACSHLKHVSIPETIISIGDYAFSGCQSLEHFLIPSSVQTIGDSVFSGCKNLHQIEARCNSKFFIDNGMLIDVKNKKLLTYFGTDDSIVVPESVCIIAEFAFSGCQNLCHITFHNQIIDIQRDAFSECHNLEQIIIPDSVTTINYSTFYNCKNLKYVFIPNSVSMIKSHAFDGCESLQFIIIPDSVTSIYDYVFANCLSLKKVLLSNSISIIPENAFYGCKSIHRIIIPNSVNTINKWAFLSCNSLQQIIIPNSVTDIGYRAFGNCDCLRRIIIPKESMVNFKKLFPKELWNCLIELLSSEVTEEDRQNAIEDCFGVVYSSDYKKLLTCKNNKIIKYEIRKGVEVICDHAFSGCMTLSQIAIPNTVLIIGNSAFSSCENLKYFVIPDSVTIIKKSAFHFCYSLQRITMPDSITTIESMAFASCDTLENILIPDSVFTIGDKVFDNCCALKNIIIINNQSFVVKNNMLIDIKNKKILVYFGNEKSVIIPDIVSIIGESSFAQKHLLEQITIPESVNRIEHDAFCECNLKDIIIPKSVTYIGNSAFYGNNNIEKIYFYGVPEIDYYAFEVSMFDDFEYLSCIVIPEGSYMQFQKMLPEQLWDKLSYVDIDMRTDNYEFLEL